ncbi:MBL fold metallo-hydrolase [Kiloniella sp. b19]|uniref:MBL fold metallo-hydrolase n=1 Tax=Kiloniella sp. GXU_MW_B19 TaxID=3141326 RepID=UPI0031DBC96B
MRKLLLPALFSMITGCSIASEADKAFDPTAPKAHHTENGFRNLYFDDNKKAGFFNFWFDVRFKEKWPDAEALAESPPIPRQEVDLERVKNPDPAEVQVTWVGHSTFLIQHDGLNILTDPIFSERASPFSFAGPKRYTKPAITLEDLPRIDAVVISHNHYDHMDNETIRALGNGPVWYVPLKNRELLEDENVTNVVELDWWEEHDFGQVRFTLTPTQHWSARGLFDRYESLWGSWAIKFTNTEANLWFGGDTGYNDVQFKQIGDRLGPFDLSLIPIGAYAPRWFMKASHVDPVDAVNIHKDILSRNSIGMHWGTFVLTSEPVTEPPEALSSALRDAELSEKSFTTLPIGGTRGYFPQKEIVSE